MSTWRHHQFFFDVAVLLLSILVVGPSSMSISWLFLELWQLLFIKDWPETRKSEIPMSAFGPISGDWGELGIPRLTRMSLIKSYWMLQNARVAAFTPSELLLRKPTGAVKLPPSSSTLIRLNDWKHQNDVIDVVLVFLILTLNISFLLFT